MTTKRRDLSRPGLENVLASSPDGTLLRVKVVPGTSRSQVVGMLGDRLKVAVAAAPEDGKANQAVCELLADAFGLTKRDVEVTEGQTRPQKIVLLSGMTLCTAAERLTKIIG